MKFGKFVKAALACALCTALFMLTGCNEEAKEQMIADSKAFCEDFKNMDFDAMYALTHDGNKYFNDIYVPDAEGSEALFEAMADNLEYEIGECTIKGKNASVSAYVSNIDMNIIMSNVLNEYFELCEADPENINNIKLDDIIYDKAYDPVAQRRNANTVFNFIKQDGKWVMESNVMIYDDVTGGYMTYYFQANVAANSAMSGVEDESEAASEESVSAEEEEN